MGKVADFYYLAKSGILGFESALSNVELRGDALLRRPS
jgi:hypothetical protein